MQLAPTAKVIADSISTDGIRITTIHQRSWRPIHAEFMTHRKFSRNGRSSRAVPVKTLLAEPIMEPLSYGMNRPGMTAGEEMTGLRLLLARGIWLGMAKMTRLGVRGLTALGAHKQWANRPLEWFGAIDVLVTATSWNNFWELRLDSGAQPEMRALAQAISDAMFHSKPRLLKPGEWHLPYVTDAERDFFKIEEALKLSTARCARLTIKPFDGSGVDIEAEMKRWHRLVGSKPVHASPAEHQATPDLRSAITGQWLTPHMHGNLDGWIQYRKTLRDECAPEAWWPEPESVTQLRFPNHRVVPTTVRIFCNGDPAGGGAHLHFSSPPPQEFFETPGWPLFPPAWTAGVKRALAKIGVLR